MEQPANIQLAKVCDAVSALAFMVDRLYQFVCQCRKNNQEVRSLEEFQESFLQALTHLKTLLAEFPNGLESTASAVTSLAELATHVNSPDVEYLASTSLAPADWESLIVALDRTRKSLRRDLEAIDAVTTNVLAMPEPIAGADFLTNAEQLLTSLESGEWASELMWDTEHYLPRIADAAHRMGVRAPIVLEFGADNTTRLTVRSPTGNWTVYETRPERAHLPIAWDMRDVVVPVLKQWIGATRRNPVSEMQSDSEQGRADDAHEGRAATADSLDVPPRQVTPASGGTGQLYDDSRFYTPAELHDLLGIHPDRREAFYKMLERNRSRFGDVNFRELRDVPKNQHRYTYRVSVVRDYSGKYREALRRPTHRPADVGPGII